MLGSQLWTTMSGFAAAFVMHYLVPLKQWTSWPHRFNRILYSRGCRVSTHRQGWQEHRSLCRMEAWCWWRWDSASISHCSGSQDLTMSMREKSLNKAKLETPCPLPTTAVDKLPHFQSPGVAHTRTFLEVLDSSAGPCPCYAQIQVFFWSQYEFLFFKRT